MGEILSVSDEPSTIRGELVPSDRNVTLNGSVQIHYRFHCSRCAEDEESVLSVPIKCTFAVGHEDERHGGGVDVDGVTESRHLALYDGSTVDLEPVILEQIVFKVLRFFIC